jgi:hypothetical protein
MSRILLPNKVCVNNKILFDMQVVMQTYSSQPVNQSTIRTHSP